MHAKQAPLVSNLSFDVTGLCVSESFSKQSAGYLINLLLDERLQPLPLSYLFQAERRCFHLFLSNHLHGPTLTTTGAAYAFNRKLERDVSSGDIPRVFSGAWVYQIPRWWRISCWQIAGLVRIQAGHAVPVKQATNTLCIRICCTAEPHRRPFRLVQ